MSNEIVGLIDDGPDKFYEVINVGELFGIDQPIERSLLEGFGQAVIDYIVDRTEKGKRYDGVKFSGYDQDYVESDEFKAYGKSKSKVNLTQTGNMLGQLDILEIFDNSITIGWGDNEERAKAYGHHTGMKGHPTLEGKTPARPFFGVTRKQIENLAGPFLDDFKGKVNDRDPEDLKKTQVTLSLLDYLKRGYSQQSSSKNRGLLDFFLGRDNGES